MSQDPTTASAPGPSAACTHPERVEGRCSACGHCEHDVILNGACLVCGTTEFDPVERSPRPDLVAPSRLVRRR
jgi:hypothetical protein